MISWFSRNLIGIVPIARDRASAGEDVLAPAREALARGDIIIIFPEGTRGSGDTLAGLKSGVAKLAAAFPQAPVTPVWLQGAGRVLPKGAFVPVPFFVDVFIGQALTWTDDSQGGDKKAFMGAIESSMHLLGEKHERPEYE